MSGAIPHLQRRDLADCMRILSSFYLLSAVPKALGLGTNIKMMASLDHSMWFYQDFDVHDWILYVVSTAFIANPFELNN